MWDDTFSPIHARSGPVGLGSCALRGSHSTARVAVIYTDAHRACCARGGRRELAQGRAASRPQHVFTHT
eukprot:10920058-Alexandrium_andersonii.AAC.1